MNENKTNINWLITIYPRTRENSYKIRKNKYMLIALFDENV